MSDHVVALRELAERNRKHVGICRIDANPHRPELNRRKIGDLFPGGATRVSPGGHDVLDEKLLLKYVRSLSNLWLAIHRLPHVLVFDNSDLRHPYRTVAVFNQREVAFRYDESQKWFRPELG